MSFLRRSATNLGGQWLNIVATFAVGVVLAQVGGTEGKGVHALLLMIATAVVLVSNLGVSRAAIYFENEGSYPRRLLIDQVWSLNWVLGPVAAVLFAVAALAAGRSTFDSVSGTALLLLSLSAPGLLLRLAASNLYAAKSDFARLNAVHVFGQLVALVMVPVAFAVFAADVAAAVVIVVMTYAGSMFGWVGLARAEGAPSLVWDAGAIRSLTSYGLRAYVYALGNFLNLRVDQLLVGALIGIPALGVYSVAVSFSELASRVSKAVTMVMYPEVSRSDDATATELTVRVSRLLFLFACVFVAVMSFLAGPLIRLLFGDDFSGAFLPLVLLLPGLFSYNLFEVLSTDLAGRGKPEIGSFGTLAGLLIAIVGNLIFAATYGLVAVAVVATVAYTASAAIAVIAFRRVTGANLLDLTVPRREDWEAVKAIGSKFASTVSSPSV